LFNLFKTVKITRLFNERGEDIKFINKLNKEEVIYASQGENWKGERDVTMAVTLNVGMIYSTTSSKPNWVKFILYSNMVNT
jgi:hypothetical protein